MKYDIFTITLSYEVPTIYHTPAKTNIYKVNLIQEENMRIKLIMPQNGRPDNFFFYLIAGVKLNLSLSQPLSLVSHYPFDHFVSLRQEKCQTSA